MIKKQIFLASVAVLFALNGAFATTVDYVYRSTETLEEFTTKVENVDKNFVLEPSQVDMISRETTYRVKDAGELRSRELTIADLSRLEIASLADVTDVLRIENTDTTQPGVRVDATGTLRLRAKTDAGDASITSAGAPVRIEGFLEVADEATKTNDKVLVDAATELVEGARVRKFADATGDFSQTEVVFKRPVELRRKVDAVGDVTETRIDLRGRFDAKLSAIEDALLHADRQTNFADVVVETDRRLEIRNGDTEPTLRHDAALATVARNAQLEVERTDVHVLDLDTGARARGKTVENDVRLVDGADVRLSGADTQAAANELHNARASGAVRFHRTSTGTAIDGQEDLRADSLRVEESDRALDKILKIDGITVRSDRVTLTGDKSAHIGGTDGELRAAIVELDGVTDELDREHKISDIVLRVSDRVKRVGDAAKRTGLAVDELRTDAGATFEEADVHVTRRAELSGDVNLQKSDLIAREAGARIELKQDAGSTDRYVRRAWAQRKRADYTREEAERIVASGINDADVKSELDVRAGEPVILDGTRLETTDGARLVLEADVVRSGDGSVQTGEVEVRDAEVHLQTTDPVRRLDDVVLSGTNVVVGGDDVDVNKLRVLHLEATATNTDSDVKIEVRDGELSGNVRVERGLQVGAFDAAERDAADRFLIKDETLLRTDDDTVRDTVDVRRGLLELEKRVRLQKLNVEVRDGGELVLKKDGEVRSERVSDGDERFVLNGVTDEAKLRLDFAGDADRVDFRNVDVELRRGVVESTDAERRGILAVNDREVKIGDNADAASEADRKAVELRANLDAEAGALLDENAKLVVDDKVRLSTSTLRIDGTDAKRATVRGGKPIEADATVVRTDGRVHLHDGASIRTPILDTDGGEISGDDKTSRLSDVASVRSRAAASAASELVVRDVGVDLVDSAKFSRDNADAVDARLRFVGGEVVAAGKHTVAIDTRHQRNEVRLGGDCTVGDNADKARLTLDSAVLRLGKHNVRDAAATGKKRQTDTGNRLAISRDATDAESDGVTEVVIEKRTDETVAEIDTRTIVDGDATLKLRPDEEAAATDRPEIRFTELDTRDPAESYPTEEKRATLDAERVVLHIDRLEAASTDVTLDRSTLTITELRVADGDANSVTRITDKQGDAIREDDRSTLRIDHLGQIAPSGRNMLLDVRAELRDVVLDGADAKLTVMRDIVIREDASISTRPKIEFRGDGATISVGTDNLERDIVVDLRGADVEASGTNVRPRLDVRGADDAAVAEPGIRELLLERFAGDIVLAKRAYALLRHGDVDEVRLSARSRLHITDRAADDEVRRVRHVIADDVDAEVRIDALSRTSGSDDVDVLEVRADTTVNVRADVADADKDRALRIGEATVRDAILHVELEADSVEAARDVKEVRLLKIADRTGDFDVAKLRVTHRIRDAVDRKRAVVESEDLTDAFELVHDDEGVVLKAVGGDTVSAAPARFVVPMLAALLALVAALF